MHFRYYLHRSSIAILATQCSCAEDALADLSRGCRLNPRSITMRAFLAFHDSWQEAKWQLKFAQDQAGLDAAFSLQTLVFPSLVASAVSSQATHILPSSTRRMVCKRRRRLRRQSHPRPPPATATRRLA